MKQLGSLFPPAISSASCSPLRRPVGINRTTLVVAMLSLLPVSAVYSQTSPAQGAYGSIWVNDGNQVGRLDFSSPTEASFTLLGTVSGFSDGLPNADGPGGSALPVMTDIAWAPDYSAMYGVFVTPTSPPTQGLVRFDPNTGSSTVVSTGVDIGNVNSSTANGAGFVNGSLYTGVDDQLGLYQINTTTGAYTNVGNVMSGATSFYSPGDIAVYGGVTYALGMLGPDAPDADTYLLELDVVNPASSEVLGIVGGDAEGFNYGFGLAAIEGTGLYGIDGDEGLLYLIDPANPANITPVTITGYSGQLAGFYGATGAPVPEPSSLVLMLSGACLGLAFRRRGH